MSARRTVQGQYFLKFKEATLWAKLTHEGGSWGQLGPRVVGQGRARPRRPILQQGDQHGGKGVDLSCGGMRLWQGHSWVFRQMSPATEWPGHGEQGRTGEESQEEEALRMPEKSWEQCCGEGQGHWEVVFSAKKGSGWVQGKAGRRFCQWTVTCAIASDPGRGRGSF